MSFVSLKKADLLAVADEFGVEVSETANKDEIIAALAEDGVTWEQAKQFVEPVAQQAAVIEREEAEKAAAEKAAEPDVLIRMQRENASFEIRGYRFTKDHPYGLVKESDADWIIENIEGFRPASPKEIQEFYG